MPIIPSLDSSRHKQRSPLRLALGSYNQSVNDREGGLLRLKDFMTVEAISGLPA